MPEAGEEDLIVELTSAVLSRTAPEELPILAATARAYLKDPSAGAKAGKQRDEMLGFGIDSLSIITPAVLAVATPVVRFLIDEVSKNLKSDSAAVIRTVVQRLFR